MSSLKDKKLNAKIKRWIKRKGYSEDFTFQDDFENALEDGDEKRVEKLMKRNPSEIVNDDRTNALLFAARRGFDDAVRIILEENEEIIDDIGLNGYAAIHYAAKYGHEDILLMLIRRGADLNIPDDGGAIALHYAASSEHLKILKVLIKNGADVNAKDHLQKSVLCYASMDKKLYSSKGVACILRLLMSGARIDKKAIENDSYKMLRHIADGTRNCLFFSGIYQLFDISCELLCYGETVERYFFRMDQTFENIVNRTITKSERTRRFSKSERTKNKFSESERTLLRTVAFMLVEKIPGVAFRVFHGVRTCMAYRGICMLEPGFINNSKQSYLTWVDRIGWNYWSIPAGITRDWYLTDEIVTMKLYYEYDYSHTAMSWVWTVKEGRVPYCDNYYTRDSPRTAALYAGGG